MTNRKLLTVLALATIIAGHARSQTTKPAGDPRLLKHVVCNAIGTDLGRVAKLLTAETGVRIHVAKDISDEKLDVFVEDCPLGKLQKDLATLFGYRWSIAPGTEASPVYVLWRDANTRSRQERLRKMKKEHVEKRLHDDVDNIKRILDMKDEDVQNLPADGRQFAEYVRGEPAFRLLFSLAGKDAEALFGDGFQGNASDLSGAGSKLMESTLSKFSPEYAGESVKYAIGLPGHSKESHLSVDANMFCVTVMKGDGNQEGRFFALTPEALKHSAERPDEGLLTEYMRGFRPADGKPDLSDPRLDKPMKQPKVRVVKYGTRTWTDETEDFNAGLQRISATSGVPIVSDYYTQNLSNQSLKGLTAREAVKRLYAAFGRTCVSKDGTLLFRNNDWPDLMPREIPNRIAVALTKAATPGGDYPNWLNFDQSLIACTLTDERLDNVGSIGWYAPGCGSEENRAILRFVNLLTPLQRGQLESSSGTDLSNLPDSLAQAFEVFYNARWTKAGYSPRVLSVRLQRNAHPPAEVPSQTYALFTFSTVSEGATKESSLDLCVAPDAPARKG